VPETRARYTLSRLHATGGLGRIWLARDAALGRDVALKELRPERAGDSAFSGRFLQEARITGQLEHPSIVPVYEFAYRPEDQQPFYTMRFVRGRTLGETIQSYHHKRQQGVAGPVDLLKLLSAGVAVCHAVAYAHSRGVIHRDLKPANIILGDFGEVIVLDWGLAKLVGAASADPGSTAPVSVPEPELPPIALALAEEPHATVPGQVVGTPAYMAPEQAEGRLDQIGVRTDVYGLGAILYEILTGRAPFSSDNTARLLQRVIHEEPTRPTELAPGTPRALEAVCQKALAKRPAQRYASAVDLAQDIQRWMADEAVSAYAEPLSMRTGRWIRRHRTTVRAGVLVLLTAAAAAAAGLVAVARQQAATARERDAKEVAWVRTRAALDDVSSAAVASLLNQQRELKPEHRAWLRKTLEYYREFAEQPDTGATARQQVAEAHVRMGALRAKLGEMAEAEAAYRRAAALYERLIAAAPNQTEYRVALAAALNHLGLLLTATSRPAEAERTYRQALELLERAAAEGAAGPRERDQQAMISNNLGLVLRQLGRPGEAETAFRRAVEMREGLLSEPDGPSDLAMTLTNLGGLLIEQGKAGEAETAFRRAMRLQEDLAAGAGSSIEFRIGLGASLNNLAALLTEMGKDREGETLSKRAVELFERAVDDEPSVPKHRDDLAASLSNLGRAMAGQNKHKDAEQAYRRALALFERLAAEGPAVAERQANLAQALTNLGEHLADRGKHDEAENAYRRAVTLRERLAAAHQEEPLYRLGVGISLNNLGDLLARRGKRTEAESAFRRSIALFERLTAEQPAAPAFAVDLGCSCFNLGNLIRDDGNPTAALDWYGRAAAALEPIVARQPLAAARQFLSNTYQGRADALGLLGRHAEAIADWDRVLALEKGGNRTFFQLARALALARAGRHGEAVAEAAPLTPPRAKVTGARALYLEVCIYALAAAQSNPQQAETCARTALELLRQAKAAGHFDDPAHAEQLRTDPDLNSLRSREDFQKLLGELKKSKAK